MHRPSPNGQTLVELVIAIGIIVMCVVAILGLTISTSTLSNASKAQILAVNLAREGIEVARHIRDNNWLAIDSGVANMTWNNGLYYQDASYTYDYTGIAEYQLPTSGTWTLLFDQVSNLSSPAAQMYYHPVKGFYDQIENFDPASWSGWSKISYWRLLHTNPICWPTGGPTLANPEKILGDTAQASAVGSDPCTMPPLTGYTQVGIQVRSQVRWLEHGRPHTVEIDDKLFNWKP
ncbi:MAG: hypothetical protein V1778_04255 [bacterium]